MSDAWSNLLTNILIKTDLANEELTKKDKTDFALISHILEQGYAFKTGPVDPTHLKTELQRHIEEFIAECEREAAKLEITVDYYLAEFV